MSEGEAPQRPVSGGSRLTRTGQARPSPLASLTLRVRNFGYSTSFYAWRLRGRFPQRLKAPPGGLWQGDAARGETLLGGAFRFGNEILPVVGLRWDALDVSPAMQAWLHSFDWLHDLTAACDGGDLAEAQAVAEPLTRSWLAHFTRYDPVAWQPDIVGERLFAWCLNPVLIAGATDHIHRSALLNMIARSARHLARTAAAAPPGLPRIAATCGLVVTSALLVGVDPGLARGLEMLSRTLDRMVLPDGGVDCRSPIVGVALLGWLLAVRDVLTACNEPLPDGLVRAIDRLTPALRGLLHANGALAAFHGGARMAPEAIATLLDRADVPSQPMRNGAFSGYQRLEYAGTVLIADCGPPPAGELSADAHASTLAFELSDPAGRVVVNCGSSQPRGSRVPFALDQSLRATAAHATLVLADTNSTQIRADGFLGRGVGEVSTTHMENEDGCWLVATHDGYARRFGMSHERKLFLRSDGMDLRGEDILLPVRRRSWLGGSPGAVAFDIRFHLDPMVEVVPTQGGQGALLRLPGGVTWSFKARGATLSVAESLMIDEHDQPRATRQLVLAGRSPAGGTAINWSFKRTPAKILPKS